jgi:hypothetical protein
MLDVHTPDHRIGGVRDFTIHLLTITVGLLIALGLENAAEAMHHRHQRKEAETNIRLELTSNRDSLHTQAPVVMDELHNLGLFLTLLQDQRDGKPVPTGKLNLQFHEAPIPDAAWRTAGSTGVLAFMDYGEVEKLAAAYKQQDMLEKAEESALEDYLEFLPLLDQNQQLISKDGAAEALPLVRRAYGHVEGMLDIGKGTLDSYDDALK